MTCEEIRLLTADDIDRVMEIENVCFPAPWEKEAFLNDLTANAAARYLGVFFDGVLAGYAGVWFLMEEAHVVNVAVAPEYRRRGLAEKLMDALIRLCADSGGVWMSLECRRSNAAAQSLYHKLGFIDVGYRRHYYENDEDALIMVKLSLPEPDEDGDPYLVREDVPGDNE